MQCKVDSTDFVSSVILELVHLTTIPSRIHSQCLPVERFLPSPGQCSTAAPPAHRLHVCMSSEDSEVFEYAAADVLDLVETVCDMVGEELGMNEDEAERLTRLIRAEKYFEANGARTPLPPSRSRQPEVAEWFFSAFILRSSVHEVYSLCHPDVNVEEGLLRSQERSADVDRRV